MIQLILAALISTTLYVFSFAPWSFWTSALSILQWFAFVPLFYYLNKYNPTYRRTFFIGFLISIGITLGGFYWVIYATEEYGGLPLPAALALFIAFCLIGQLQVPFYLVLRKKALESVSLKKWFWIGGFVYAGIESFYPKLFLDSAGHAFSGSLYFSQIADAGGVFFITVLVISFAETLAFALNENNRKNFKLLIAPISIFVLCFGYGAFRVGQIRQLLLIQKNTPTLKVALVQANIGDYMKVAAEKGLNEASDEVIKEYLKYSTQALSYSPDAIVWPETAYPALFGKPTRSDEGRMENHLREFASTFPGTMIFGGYDRDTSSRDYNSMFFLPSSEAKAYVPIPTYHKTILLMFGETLPFAEFFPSIKEWFPTMGFFGRGPGPEVYPVKNAKGEIFKIAPSICYEGLFPTHSLDGARLGADALLNITNDSWFGPNGEPYLHFALTRFRTIETRLPMLRSTNTGVTALINPLGELEGQTSLFKAEVLPVDVHPHLAITTPFQTIAGVFGNMWFERLSQICVLFILGLIWMKKKKNHSRLSK